jgi:ElaB/YqjD/DUF883 family membrane-anchored ribosome-binding protein
MAQEISIDKRASVPADARSIDEIRSDIEKTRQNITGTVDVLGSKLQKQLDWREYVRKKPLIAVGIGVGAGFVISRLVVSKPKPRFSLVDFMTDSVAKTVTQLMRPKPESIFKSAAKMVGGMVVAQIASSLQPPSEEHEMHHQQHYAPEHEYKEKRQ